jgi:F0F1-type ATP synthase membrane subunit b/b'
VWFIFPTLLAVVAAIILILYWRLKISYRSLEARCRELSQRYEEVVKQYEEAKRALEAARLTISAHVEERDAARRYAEHMVKKVEQRVKEAEAEVARLKKAIEEKERELASTKARLEEGLQACVQSLNYLRGRYAELKPEQPLWARAVDLHIAAQLPPRGIYGILIEVPYVDLDREIMRRRKIEQLLLEKYGIAKLPPLRIATETNVVVIEKSRVAKFRIPHLPPAVYIANYGLLVWRPRPSLHTVYSNIDKYLNEW